jgi:hypothetical protein
MPPDGLPAKKIRGHAKGGLIRPPHGDKLAVGGGDRDDPALVRRGAGAEDDDSPAASGSTISLAA